MVISIEVGECIYCGDSGSDLRREHIIPFALWGEDVLRRATCASCQAATSAVEGHLLRGSLLGFRSVLGAPTRDISKRPTEFPAHVMRNGTWQGVMLPSAANTGTAIFPILGPPSALVGRADDDLIIRRYRIIMATAGAPIQGTWSPAVQAGAEKVMLPLGYDPRNDPTIFARLVAKIALGYAVAEFGIGSFRPSVTYAILGGSNDIGCWVGGSDHPFFDGPAERGHRVRVGDDGHGGLIAGVQLFVESGAPEYVVAVGRLD